MVDIALFKFGKAKCKIKNGINVSLSSSVKGH